MQLSDLQAAVQAYGYGTDTVTQQTYFINRTYRQVTSSMRWAFLEAQDSSMSTVPSQLAYTPSFSLPWRAIDAVRLQQVASNGFWNLRFMPAQEFREYVNIDRDVSTPYYWSFIDQQIQFYPIPDQVYNLVVDYIFEPPDLVNPTDVPVIPIPYHDILVYGAVSGMAARERDWLGRNFYMQEFEQWFTRLKEEYYIRQRQTSPHVIKSGYWEEQMPYPFIHDGW